MRMTLLAVLAVPLLASVPASAAAAAPEHLTESFSFYDEYPENSVCDFNMAEEGSAEIEITRFFDQSGNRVRAHRHTTVWVRHINLDTGYFLDEEDAFNVTNTFGPGDGYTNIETQTISGQWWHLRDPDGKLVLSGAGHLYADDAMSTETPNLHSDYAQTLCPLLGGAVAPPP